jgi:hypothetical protein
MSVATPFKALYYPYSRCINENTIKRAILIFDELVFVDLASPKLRDNLLSDKQDIPKSVMEDWKVVRDSYGPLIEDGLVKLFDPELIVREHDILLANAFKADLNDNEIWKLCTKLGLPVSWSILRRKVPPSAFEFLNSQTLLRITYSTDRARAVLHGDNEGAWTVPAGTTDPFDETIDTIFSGDWLRYLFHDGKVSKEMDSWYIRGDDERRKHLENAEFSCVFPYTHGSVLTVNTALMISDLQGFIPFTDSQLHHDLLLAKYRRVRANTEARQATREPFERLRNYIAELTSAIESEVWDDKFEKEVNKIVHQKIVPEVQKAKHTTMEIYEKLFGKLAKKAIVALAPTMGASVFAGLLWPAMLTIGSAAVLGTALPDLIDAYVEERKSRRNALTYLLEIAK